MARILILDDKDYLVEQTLDILENHKGVGAYTSEQALEELKNNPFDLVVTDWHLGGTSYSDQVIATATEANIPVIVHSGTDDSTQRLKQFLEHPCVQFVAKESPIAALREAASRALKL